MSGADRIETATIARADGLMAAEAGDELLMMNVDLGRYFNLNAVGARVWELLETPTTLDRLVEALTAEYSVSPDIARAEVTAFLKELHARGLVKVGDAAAA
ncbi:MAG: PqqD family peptide modification chaperone [Pseudomonadota bacterium]